ncbi:PEP-CTERM sorting domain-containing protein [Roseateles oligotrophus]|uniref:PEP-CTERM sorting domain-containing protein n=1 Tax=Roseateles oligotrophus TaxID=1769250 RepID=A0ABT2Y8K8_9BURK|nr:PEP-CTERM sorting domain-containing protein [Roseateles oligotrophus]MCV2366627.1 PEP-CTERM sorting domain-containing protein [Roseateles oligotrophus]
MKFEIQGHLKIPVLLLLSGLATHVHASGTVVLDSFGPGDAVEGWPTQLYQDGSGRQDVAIPFTLSVATSIESILTSIDGLGGVTVGIMAKQGAVPSASAWLYSSHLDNPVANSMLTPGAWTLAAGNYWLAAIADNGFSGSWQSGTDVPTVNWAYTSNAGAWQEVTSQFIGLPAARITVSAVPEPASYALMLAGGLLIATALRRQNRKAVGAPLNSCTQG